MIRVRSDWRGRPGKSMTVATVDTPKEAVRVVKLLRPHGITATWKPHPPYTVRTSFQDAQKAVNALQLAGLE